jgi:hypothetical protein
MSRIISPRNLYLKISEFLFLFNHMHEFLHFISHVVSLQFKQPLLLFFRGLHHKCQMCNDKINAPSAPLFNMTSPWPFVMRGIDVIQKMS